MDKYDLSFFAPVPAGHKVKITWFKKLRSKPTNDEGEQYTSLPYAPIVRDMDTNIVYAATELFSKNEHLSFAGVQKLLDQPRDEFELEYQLVGKVLECRVFSQQVAGTIERTHVQTTLMIEPTPEKGPYR